MRGRQGPLVLGLETSCDETSAAVLSGDDRILGHVILSQDVHQVYGGVVPELAARAHLQRIDAVVERALDQADVALRDVQVLGVTAGPGLIGALLVGVCWAKAAAYGLGRPWVAVHHMEAHLFSPSLEDPEAEPPFVALLVSGGHTLLLHAAAWGEYRLLGQTRDDAAGEAFDKVAKLLGLRYPGGPEIQRLAASGDAGRHRLPRPMLARSQRPDSPDYYDFSFSGLKTAVVELVRSLEARGSLEGERAHVAAAFQEAAVDVLASKTMRAVDETGCRRVLMGGGVSANRALREELVRRLGEDARLFVSTPRLALDNGAMVARAARFRYELGEVAGADASASASLAFPGLLPGR
ncbi:MAG TPA: tRNA (adenosine(37)-N6)-threonylcarbamoyltransferase complex transferase subunit TsaD [Longimicrobiales bacterium]|nr:tRNA (adenosine(37)-N6)-threonylcarbamoyltransferase complex transferase subunit TsaD [Longimicrobiales bacterium]